MCLIQTNKVLVIVVANHQLGTAFRRREMSSLKRFLSTFNRGRSWLVSFFMTNLLNLFRGLIISIQGLTRVIETMLITYAIIECLLRPVKVGSSGLILLGLILQ